MNIQMSNWTRLCTGTVLLAALPLLAYGQNLTQQLHSAARAFDSNAVQNALDLGVAVDARDAYNWTALMLVAAVHAPTPEQSEAAARLLIEAGADVNARSLDGWSPLHFSGALGNNPTMVEILLSAGADIEARTMETWSAEMTLVRYTGEQRLQRSIGPSMATGSDIGYTPLMAAAKFGKPELVKALLTAGADTGARDERNRRACDYIRGRNELANSNLSELLCRDE